jgi:hypothetical protein
MNRSTAGDGDGCIRHGCISVVVMVMVMVMATVVVMVMQLS